MNVSVRKKEEKLIKKVEDDKINEENINEKKERKLKKKMIEREMEILLVEMIEVIKIDNDDREGMIEIDWECEKKRNVNVDVEEVMKKSEEVSKRLGNSEINDMEKNIIIEFEIDMCEKKRKKLYIIKWENKIVVKEKLKWEKKKWEIVLKKNKDDRYEKSEMDCEKLSE